jgi:hypothetical protein
MYFDLFIVQMQQLAEPEKLHRPCAHYAESTVSTALKEQSKFQPPSKPVVALKERPPVRSSENGVPISFASEHDRLLRRRSRSLSPYRSCGCRRHDPDSPRRSRSVSSPSPRSPVSLGDRRHSATGSFSPNGSLLDYQRQRSPTDRSRLRTVGGNLGGGRTYAASEFWRPISEVDGRQRLREDHSTKLNASFAPRLESVLNHSQVRARASCYFY